MCGRFALSPITGDVEKLLPELKVEKPVQPRYNIAPTQDVASVVNDGSNELVYLHWGLIPSWAKDMSIGSRMINARAETLSEKPAFKNAFNKRRCLVFATGYYEWKKVKGRDGKAPYFIRLKSQKPFTFAGLWETWGSNGSMVHSCTLITTVPTEYLKDIHHRMPVILNPELREEWLQPGEADITVLSDYLVPFELEEMEAFEVSTLVNNPLNDSPDCIRPVTIF